MKIIYEDSKLTIGDVSMDLFKKIIQAIEDHEAGKEEKQKAEHWRGCPALILWGSPSPEGGKIAPEGGKFYPLQGLGFPIK